MKLVSFILTSLFAATSFAQAVNPASLADYFILCSSQAQTEQLIVPMQDATTPTASANFVVTDAPGSQNILEMNQLGVTSASFDDKTVTVEAEGIIDFNLKISVTANAVGEFNITPTTKTMVYLGTLNHSAKGSSGYSCVVLTSQELMALAPQQP